MVGEKNMVGTASILEMSKLFRLERKKKRWIFSQSLVAQRGPSVYYVSLYKN